MLFSVSKKKAQKSQTFVWLFYHTSANYASVRGLRSLAGRAAAPSRLPR